MDPRPPWSGWKCGIQGAYWLHSWRENRPLKYIGFHGQGHQVRDCLHPRDLGPLVLAQMQARDAADKPALVNVSGGSASARSLAQLSRWCADRWGSRVVGVAPDPRPFDLPWVVLDHALASQVWDWQPQSTTDDILTEIAEHADRRSDWLALSN